MEWISAEELIDDLQEGLGEGPLTVGIYCTNCNAQFELNNEAVALAMITNTTFLEYLKYVQSSKCPKCEGQYGMGKC